MRQRRGRTAAVSEIGDYTFSNCSTLTAVTLPDGLTSIARGAFGGCSSLTAVALPDSLTSIGDGAFYGCPLDAEPRRRTCRLAWSL